GGYKGITVHFWDESRKNWATWTDARPMRDGMFDPLKRFREDGPWSGCGTPDQASQNQLRLLNAFRNASGRLSGRSATKALVVAPTDLSALPNVLTGWSKISAQAAALFGGGLTSRLENQELVLLRPSDWGPPLFDTLRQELLRPIVDETGHTLNLWLPFAEENRAAIEWLERLPSTERPIVLGAIRLVVGQGKASGKSTPVKPASRRAGTVGNDSGLVGEEAEVELDGDPLELTGPATPLGRLLITALAELETLAENGVVARRDPKVLEDAARRMDTLGLAVCARPVARLATELRSASPQENAERPAQIAGTLLRVAYVLHLTADAELASNATAVNAISN
ncbi:MAG: hypothetical protein NT069_00445, partial [Planctomycetota bacterium]|nr:hypothetical protein [Planctomycetota bacterium]